LTSDVVYCLADDDYDRIGAGYLSLDFSISTTFCFPQAKPGSLGYVLEP